MRYHDESDIFRQERPDWMARGAIILVIALLLACPISMISMGYGEAWAGLGLMLLRLFLLAPFWLLLGLAIVAVGAVIAALLLREWAICAAALVFLVVLLLLWFGADVALEWLSQFDPGPRLSEPFDD